MEDFDSNPQNFRKTVDALGKFCSQQQPSLPITQVRVTIFYGAFVAGSGEDATGNLLVQKHAAAKKFRRSDETLPLFKHEMSWSFGWFWVNMQLISDL